MDPSKQATAPPAGWNQSEKSGVDPQPPPYQDYNSTDNQPPPAGYPQPPAGYPQPPAGYPQPPAGYPQGHPFGPAYGQPYQGPYQGGPPVSVQPAVYVTAGPLVQPLPDYLGYSIFTMLCCCLPLGIAALIYSINTRDANAIGNRIQAERSSRMARILNNTALGIGIVFIVVYIVLFVISVTSYN